MHIGMIVSNMNASNGASHRSQSVTDDAATNRSKFLELLTAVNSMNDSQEDPLLNVTEENRSQLLLDVATIQQRSSEEEMQLIEKEVEELLHLLPDYLRYEIETLLKQASENTFDANHLDKIMESILNTVTANDSNNPIELISLSDENLTLAQMFVQFIQLLTHQRMNQNATTNESLEQMRNMLKQALKAETQVTGMSNVNEILAKLEKMLASNHESKHSYLQGVITRLTNTANKQEQSGLNMSTVVDSSQAMSRVQQFVIHIGEQPTKEAEQRQFIRQFQDIIGRGLLLQLNNGTTQFTIKLHPQHLGRLDIQLLQTNGSIIAKITASTTAARELIEAQIHQLRNTFAQQQINVERIEVTEQQQPYHLNKDGEGRQQQEDGRKSKKEDKQQNEESFANLLNEITFNEKV